DDERLVTVRAQSLIDSVANEVEREEDVFAAQVRRDVKSKDVRMRVAGSDGCESLRAELRLEHGIDAGIVRFHDHHAVLEHELDRLVVARHSDAKRTVIADAESPDQLVAIHAGELVNTPARDPELVPD